MWDIYWGLGLTVALSALLFCLARAISRRIPQRLSTLIACALLLLILLYIRDLWNSRAVARLLPFSNLIVLGNWLPLAMAILSGLSWAAIPGRIWRKSIYAGSLLLLSLYSLCHPLWGQVPHCRNAWSQSVCLQTTEQTCSPAAAATLLTAYGIPASEQEMAELCLTRQPSTLGGRWFSRPGGTYWQGLYRGLTLKTQGTPWRVEAFANKSHGDLLLVLREGPAILTVGLPLKNRNPVYEQEWGWVPGVSHSAVAFRLDSTELWHVGDPSFGLETWSTVDLQTVWQGEGIRLVKRERQPAEPGAP